VQAGAAFISGNVKHSGIFEIEQRTRLHTSGMQVAMKRNVIRRRLVEPKSPADNESKDGGVQSVDRALLIISLSKRWPKTMRDIG
jgi:hypothetical protein